MVRVMDLAYTYRDPTRLYLNATNRCTNRCSFCVRFRVDGLGGAVLRGEAEPDLEGLLAAVEGLGGPAAYREIIWCGFGEPTFRLDLIVAAAPRLRIGQARIRLNTNGHACLIHGRDVLPELSGAVDEVSVSLNAPSCARYLELCRPTSEALPGGIPRPTGASTGDERFWHATVEFLRRAPACFDRVQASVVGIALSAEEIEETRELALSLGAHRFRVR